MHRENLRSKHPPERRAAPTNSNAFPEQNSKVHAIDDIIATEILAGCSVLHSSLWNLYSLMPFHRAPTHRLLRLSPAQASIMDPLTQIRLRHFPRRRHSVCSKVNLPVATQECLVARNWEERELAMWRKENLGHDSEGELSAT